MQKFNDFILAAVVICIPLNQLLYINIGGLNFKIYQGLLILLVLLTLINLREGKPLWHWQKIGLAFFICAIISEMYGLTMLQSQGTIPQPTKETGGLATYFGIITLYLFASMCFALQIARFVSKSPTHFETALTWATLSAIFPTVYGIYQISSYFFGYEVSFLEFDRIIQRDDAVRGGIYFNNGLGRVSSTYFEPAPYGSYLSTIIPIIVASVQVQAKKKMPLWQIFVLILALINVGLSFSTTGVLSILVFFMVYFWMIKLPLRFFWNALTVTLVLLIVWILVDSDPWIWRMIDTFIIKKLTEDSFSTETISRLERLQQIQIGFSLFFKHPLFGVGPYLPLFIELEKLNAPMDVHSSIAIVYVQMLASFGVLGTTVAVIFFSRLTKQVWFEKQSHAPPEIKQLRPVMAALLVSLFVIFVSLGTIVATNLWLVLGLMIGYLRYEEQHQELFSSMSRQVANQRV